ncbi:MAG TPA: AAA family ATPase [Nocardioidaceae bacterium]|nr:AAA family ATPase [Nocardioidaceae bacterium]
MGDSPGVGSAPLVGRDRELATLHDAVRRCAEGKPQTALVTGEAGIGKTRLIEEFRASTTGAVLAGGCVPVVGEALPFGPIAQAIRDFVRQSDGPAPALPPDLARLLPADHDRPQARAGSSALDAPVSASAQVRLFEAVLAFLAELGRGGQVTLMIEDLHWADRSTLDLVGFLARNLRAEPVLLVLTLRSDDVGPDTAFRTWLAELERLASVDRMRLSRLTPDATTRLLTGLLGAPPTAAQVDLIYQRAAGNPLFTEHLVGLADDPEAPPPPTLRGLLGSRVSVLGEPTRRALRVASVLGRVVDLDLLAAVAGESEATVEEALREAVDRHVMEPRTGGDYGFRHPLFREVVYADLLPGERRRLHAAAAEALARLDDGATYAVVGEVARHWQAAGDVGRAFDSAVAAGLAAEAVYAFADADEHLARAVALARQLPEGAFVPLDVDRVELLAHSAQAAHLAGHGDRAVAAVRAALPMAADPARQAQLLEREGAYRFNTGEFAEAEAAYQAALDRVEGQPSTPTRARVYAGLGMLAMASTRLAAAAAACRQAIDIAAAVGEVREEGRALNALGVVTAYGGDFESGIAYLRRSLAIAVQIDDPDDLGAAYIDLTHVLCLAGEFDEAAEVGRAGIDELSRVGLVRQDGSFLQGNVAESLIKSGRWAEAATLLADASASRPQGLRVHPLLVQCARLALATGDLAEAAGWIKQGTALASDGGVPDAWRREMLEADAELALWRRQPERAADLVDEGLELVECGDEQRFAGPLVALGLRAAADAAEDARARRAARAEAVAVDHGLALAERARRLDPDPLDPDRAWCPDGPALALTAQAELARLESRADARRWDLAADAWARIGRPLPEAYARWREADATVRADRGTERGLVAVRRAHELATGLGAAGLAGEVVELARWYRIDLTGADVEAATDVEAAAGSTGPEAEEAAPAAIVEMGLTPRELEVLAGLAAGQTNRELADSLFISVKTASVHVSNILRKLDVDGRAEAARVAYRLGLDRGS